MKCCYICKNNKDIGEFGKLSSSKDGLRLECKQCRKDEYRAKSDILKERQRQYHLQNPHVKISWNLANSERNRVVKQKWYEKNAEQSKARHREWTKKNKHLNAARSSKYRADKLFATPKWLTPQQKLDINRFYETCPAGYHVDHIIPLKGKQVCGLHVPWNLQHLSATDNLKKNNRVG